MQPFVVIGGSHVGTHHANPGEVGAHKNSQDSFLVHRTDDLTIGVVCDGCGSGVCSEFGSRLQATLLVKALRDNVPVVGALSQDEGEARQQIERILFRVQQQVVGEMSSTARALLGVGDSLTEFVKHHMLATAVGFVITPNWTFVFSCGDGYFGINGKVTQIGPFDKNAPPYLAYALTGSSVLDEDRSALDLKIRILHPTTDVASVWVATDGIEDLIASAEKFMPGKSVVVGPLDQIWTDPAFLKPARLQRWLNLVNCFVPVTSGYPNPSRGHLSDDTTIVAAIRPATSEV